MKSLLTERLAIAGGEPLSTLLTPAPWPPTIESTEHKLLEVFRSRKWSFNGPQEQAFCREFADYHGAKHGIFMANGTVTLQCALQALGIGEGDEVIIPALTWPATAMAVLYVGAVPVFADIEPDTLCLDPLCIEAAITPRTRAIIPVHLYGSMADIEAILKIAERHDIKVIEDCAHAHGGIWNGKGVGSWGVIGSFSFQQSKTMSSGEGGICITDDDELAERLYRLKHIGYPPAAAQGKAGGAPDADLMCSNFRATDFQAVILRDQLRELKTLLETYATNAALLEELLADVPGIRPQVRGRLADIQGYYSWCAILEQPLSEIPMARIQEALGAEGLWLPTTYGPVYNHILWNVAPGKYRLPQGGCPVAEGPAKHNTLVVPHEWLGAPRETIETMAAIISKIAFNASAL